MSPKAEIFFESRGQFRRWLQENHPNTDGIWVVFFKPSTRLSDVSWESIVEECLCFGWIDSVPGKVDDQRTKIYISPRKPNSGWSRRNKNLILELEIRGLITPPGFAAIERAKANGSWTRFDLAEDMVMPPEMMEAFGADEEFATAWAALTDSKKRQFLQQIYEAKTDQTRIRRIRQTRTAICT